MLTTDGLTEADFGFFPEPKPISGGLPDSYFDEDTLRALGLDPDSPDDADEVQSARNILGNILALVDTYKIYNLTAEDWTDALCDRFPRANRDLVQAELEELLQIQADLAHVRCLVAASQKPQDYDYDYDYDVAHDLDLDLFPNDPPQVDWDWDDLDESDTWEDIQDREAASWEATSEQSAQKRTASTRSCETSAAFAHKSGARSDGDDGDGDDSSDDDLVTTAKPRNNHKKNTTSPEPQNQARIYNTGPIYLLEAAAQLNTGDDPDPDDYILPDPYRVPGDDDGVYRYLRKAVLAYRLDKEKLTARQKRCADTYFLLSIKHIVDVIKGHFRRCGIRHASGFIDDVISVFLQKIVCDHDFGCTRNINIKMFLAKYFRDISSLARFCDGNSAYGGSNALSHIVDVSGTSSTNGDEAISPDDVLGYVHHHFFEDGKPRDLADDWVEREDLAHRLYYDGEETMPLDHVLIFVERNIDWGRITPENRERIRRALREVTGFCEQRIINSLVARANPQRERDRKIFAPVQDVSRKLLQNVFQMQLFEGACV